MVWAGSVFTDLTTFTKSNNIFTNLNQQFPNTGPGTPGSGVGTPNATFLYNPSTFTAAGLVPGSDLADNGVDFLLASNSTGQDFDEVSANHSLTISSDVNSATAVYLLTSSYNGTSFNVTFTGDGGATETFNVVGVPDFCNGGPINSASAVNGSATNNLLDQTVLQVQDVGACATGNSSNGFNATYDLTEQTFVLNSSFAGQDLTSTQIFSNGNTTLVLGETVESTGAATPEPATWVLALGALVLGAGLSSSRILKRDNGGYGAICRAGGRPHGSEG
jgi:hypothetical protein